MVVAGLMARGEDTILARWEMIEALHYVGNHVMDHELRKMFVMQSMDT